MTNSNVSKVKGVKGQYNVTINIGPMDFTLLRQQKRDLLQLQSEQNDKVKAGSRDRKSNLARKHFYTLEGIINFLDHIQDESEKAGVPEAVVFGKKK
jgi:hypothetical protein